MCTIGDTVHLHSPRVDIDRREVVSTSAGVSQNDKVCYKFELILYILITSQCSGCVITPISGSFIPLSLTRLGAQNTISWA